MPYFLSDESLIIFVEREGGKEKGTETVKGNARESVVTGIVTEGIGIVMIEGETTDTETGTETETEIGEIEIEEVEGIE